jgi:signal peptidase I
MNSDRYETFEKEDPRAVKEAELRFSAAWRSWICPGIGLAMAGYGAVGIVEYVASIAAFPLIFWFCFQPNMLAVWIGLAALLAGIILFIAEQFVVHLAVLRQPNPVFFVRGIVVFSMIGWLGALASVVFLLASFGSVRLAGTGMSPTIEKGELLVYHKILDWDRVRPGAIILYRNAEDSAWGEPNWQMTGRILAGPGDKLSIANGHYLVNGKLGPKVAITGGYEPAIRVPLAPMTLTVPETCYFIVQDLPSGGGYDSQILSWARKDSILAARFWYVSGRGFFKPVEED